MRIELTDELARELRDTLRQDLDELATEISHTDSREFRALLQNRRLRLEHILGQLEYQAESAQSYV